jgi:hypothetical protein
MLELNIFVVHFIMCCVDSKSFYTLSQVLWGMCLLETQRITNLLPEFLISLNVVYLNTAMQLCCRLWNLLKTVANSAVIVSLTLPYARFQQPSSPRVILMKHVQSALRIIRKARSFVYCLVHMVGWLFFGKHDDLYMSVMHQYSQ